MFININGQAPRKEPARCRKKGKAVYVVSENLIAKIWVPTVSEIPCPARGGIPKGYEGPVIHGLSAPGTVST
jgi:hypothetical protein